MVSSNQTTLSCYFLWFICWLPYVFFFKDSQSWRWKICPCQQSWWQCLQRRVSSMCHGRLFVCRLLVIVTVGCVFFRDWWLVLGGETVRVIGLQVVFLGGNGRCRYVWVEATCTNLIIDNSDIGKWGFTMFYYWFTSLVTCCLFALSAYSCKQGASEVYQRYEWPRGLRGSGSSRA